MIRPREVHYPSSDGQPMAETEAHADAMIELIETIRTWLDDAQRWHVHGNQLFYDEEGNPRASFAPDVYVIEGIPQLPKRPLWKLWEEPKAVPRLVIELTSASSATYDVTTKKARYEALGVEEYVVFDVLRDLRRPPLRLWRREGGALVEQASTFSAVLGLRLEPEGDRLRLVDQDGNVVPTPREQAEAEAARADAEATRADAEANRAHAEATRADAEANRADTEATRADAEANRADTEATRADTEAARANAEVARREALEREVAALRARLGSEDDASK